MAKTNRIVDKINTIGELRIELLNIFTDLKNGAIELKEAAELNNTAGKIINSAKVELEYYSLTKKTPGIKFISESK